MTSDRERFDEEVAFHLEQETARQVRRGLPPDEAGREARRRFGGIDRAREHASDHWRLSWLRDFGRDLRLAARTTARAPGFAATAVVTMALGVGAAAAMYSVVDGVLMRPLPYSDPDRLVRLYQLGDTGRRNNVSEPNFEDWQRGTHGFTAMAEVSNYGEQPVLDAGPAQLARVAVVSRDFFSIMGTQPQMGRAFSDQEQRLGGPPAAIVSASFWTRWKGTAPLAGEIIRSGQTRYTVVGVMPPTFDYPRSTDVWLARGILPPQRSRTAHNYQVVARVAPGVSVDAARQELSALSRALKSRYGTDTWMADAATVPLLETLTSTSRPTVSLLFAASLILLAVACSNVSNLVVARLTQRRTEFAVQSAIGASGQRIGRQVFAETLVLSLAGTVAGVLLAWGAVRLFVATGPRSLVRLDQVTLAPVTGLWILGIATATAFAAAMIAARQVRASRLAATLGDSTRTGSASRRSMQVRQTLIVMQVALTLVLLAGAALLGRSLTAVLAIAPGYSLEEALLADVTMPTDPRDGATSRVAETYRALVDGVRQFGGVTHVGLAGTFPLDGEGSNGTFIEMTRADEITDVAHFNPAAFASRQGSATYLPVGGDYFAAMSIPVLKGRVFDARDGFDTTHVGVVSRSLADAQWPGQDPLGRWIQFGNMDGDLRGIQIVGVVEDVRAGPPESPATPTMYVSMHQRPASSATLVVRGDRHVVDRAEDVTRLMRRLNADVPVKTRALSATLAEVVGHRRFALQLVGAFSITALALALVGIYGLMAFVVSQRSRELSIRQALGAAPRSVVWLIIRQGLTLTVMGAGIGLLLSRAGASMLRGQLYGVAPYDGATLGTTAVGLAAATLVAAYLPTRRVSRRSAAEVLRDN